MPLTYAAAASVPVAAYARWIEPVSLQVRHHTCTLPGLTTDRPLRLVHLSDLHASPVVPNSLIESAVGLALDLRPDLICVTGDFVTHRGGWDSDWYRRTLRRLSAAAPSFATMGNHDGGWRPSGMDDSARVRNLVRDSGLEVLHNHNASLKVGGATLELVGLADVWSREFLPDLAFPAGPRTQPRIVLSHNPDTKDRLADRPWDLMLSGHTHGGQVVVPFMGAPWAPVTDMRYLHGMKPWGTRQIHVTSGVGNALGVRLNCPPEIALIELTAGLVS